MYCTVFSFFLPCKALPYYSFEKCNINEVYLLNDLFCRGQSSQYGVWSNCAQITWIIWIQEHSKVGDVMQACLVWSLHFLGEQIIFDENFMGMVFKPFFKDSPDQTHENETQSNPVTDWAKPKHPQIIAVGHGYMSFFFSEWTHGGSFANVCQVFLLTHELIKSLKKGKTE